MKKILVPTDFSTCAKNAIDFAVQSAKFVPMEITLLNAFELIGNIYTDYMGVNKEFNQSQLHEVQNKLANLKSSIQQTEGVIVDTDVYNGTVKESILETTKEKNIDLIIMGTAGANGLKEKLWGSKTADIIGKSQVPVMAIPLEYTWKKPVKFLLATNHFEKDPAILDFLFEMAELYKAQVHVVVFTDEEDDQAITFLEHTRNIPEYEKMLKEQYREDTIVVAHLFGNNFEEVLQEYIRKNEIDILAMVTYKRSLPDRIFHPSMTKRMAYHTKIPLLAIPANRND
jgi:nucleotide-binding universal stress UspA family protein